VRPRSVIFLGAAALLGTVLIFGLTGLPDFGHYPGPYGLVLDGVAVSQRHATDVVTSVNFDYRAFDTLGEEFILFGSVLAVVILLRELREGERAGSAAEDEHRFAGASDLLRGAGVALLGSLVVLGGYVATHGTLTPGGGFQGGVVLATAPLALFLAGRALTVRLLPPQHAVEITEAAGAAGYAFIGVAGLVFASAFLENFLPFGTPGSLLSGGTMPLSNIAVAFEVGGAFLVLWREFIDQALLVPPGG
jgi:multicomponent Na+:H+ antiporter subunit B